MYKLKGLTTPSQVLGNLGRSTLTAIDCVPNVFGVSLSSMNV